MTQDESLRALRLFVFIVGFRWAHFIDLGGPWKAAFRIASPGIAIVASRSRSGG